MLLTRWLSPQLASLVGNKLGDLTFYVIGIRKQLVLAHLARVFNHSADDSNSKYMARAIYQQLGQTAIEHVRLLTQRKPKVLDRLTISGEEIIVEARRKGNGVILVTGHFGYWELLGAAVAGIGHPITVVGKDLHNPIINHLILEGRERLGMNVINMTSAPSKILKELRKNNCIGLLIDQDAGPGGVFVNFLGIKASTYQGPALLALRTGAPIVPCFIIRSGPENHQVHFENPIETTPTGNESEDIKRITQTYTDILAQYILNYPDHWFWVHRRWKTKAPAT